MEDSFPPVFPTGRDPVPLHEIRARDPETPTRPAIPSSGSSDEYRAHSQDDSDVQYHRQGAYQQPLRPLYPSHHHHHHRRSLDGETHPSEEDGTKDEREERRTKGISIEIGDPTLEEGWSTKPLTSREEPAALSSPNDTDKKHKNRRHSSKSNERSDSDTSTNAEEEAIDYFPDIPNRSKKGHRFAAYAHRLEEGALRQIHSLKDKSQEGFFRHGKQTDVLKKRSDLTPHELFAELAELQPTEWGGLWWKETARWIRYEETVEGADNRWGKPHIPFLNFNALFNLRKGLEQGAVLLDLDEVDFPGVTTRVIDHMVDCDLLQHEYRDPVISMLLLRHQHIKENYNERIRRASRVSANDLTSFTEERLRTSQSAATLERKITTRSSLANIMQANTSVGNFIRRSSMQFAPSGRKISLAMRPNIGESDGDLSKRCVNVELMKKLPEGAEAVAVFVGAVDFLTEPTMAFIRLAESAIMENVVEVPIPVRFLFILLGPTSGDVDYYEVGRSLGTLMINEAFRLVAYKAHSRGQLLSAINEFLNTSIVLPPADWKDDDLIQIDKIREKTRDNRKKQKEKHARKLAEKSNLEGTLSSSSLLTKKLPQVGVDVAALAVEKARGKDEPPKRDPLIRTGKLFYGVVQDVRIRYSQYLSDFRDGVNLQVLSSCIFIFFACLSPAITFGGMYADETDGYLGVGETLLVTAINGVIFALFAGQPIIIAGSTGPLMIFDLSLLKFCQAMELDFLSIRVWVGAWLVVIGLLVAAFEVMAFGRKITRFTEEIFSTLICLIFIYGAIEKIDHIFREHPLTDSYYGGLNDSCLGESNETTQGESHSGSDDGGVSVVPQPNTALLSLFLMIGTFIIAWKLKNFRNSKYLGRTVRRTLGDFGVPIAIFLMVLLDYLIKDTYTDKLTMPQGLKPSNSEVRGWLINPLGVVKPLPVWCMAAASLGAMLLFVLVFIEVNICQLILCAPERCMKKGTGFHLDIVLACFINLVSGVLGAPFMGPACIRTIAHMVSLTVMNTNVPPGESPKIVGCIEQRVSPLVVAILVGLSAMLYMVLNLVPIAVLLGIFLYMGISAAAGIQLFDRFVLLFKPVKHHPNVPYAKKVKTMKMHLFTLIEILMLVILWLVKKSPAALAMPFVLLCLIPIRLYVLPFLFSAKELSALDGHEDSMHEAESELDFYEAAHGFQSQLENEANHDHLN